MAEQEQDPRKKPRVKPQPARRDQNPAQARARAQPQQSKEIPRRKLYKLDDMPAERDGIDIFGTVYDFVGPSDIGAESLAEITRLEALIREQELLQAGSDEAADVIDNHIAVLDAEADAVLIAILGDVSRRMRVYRQAEQRQEQVEELLRLAYLRTAVIFDDAVPEDVQQSLTMRQHQWIYSSFMQASSAGGTRLAAAMERMQRGEKAAEQSTT